MECWVILKDGNGTRMRRWLPKRLVLPPHTGVCRPSGAIGAKKDRGTGKSLRVPPKDAHDG